jgi:hypothetical protein
MFKKYQLNGFASIYNLIYKAYGNIYITIFMLIFHVNYYNRELSAPSALGTLGLRNFTLTEITERDDIFKIRFINLIFVKYG